MRTTIATFVAVAAATTTWGLSVSALSSDAEFVDLLNSGAIEELWVAQGRVGNAAASGDQEFDLGFSTSVPSSQRQFAWSNNQPVTFDVSYDANTDELSFTAAGLSTMTLADAGAASEIYIRVASTVGHSSFASTTLSSLTLNGAGVPDISVATTAADSADYLILSDFGAGSFTLSGQATLDFDPSDAPRGSRLSFQVKGIVPAPGAASLLAMAGLACARRRR